MEAVPYTCCRCEYQTSSKKLMRRHLYERKVVCPTKHNVELTDMIKEHIVNYRIYHVPSLTALNRAINNYIANTSFVRKVQQLAHHAPCSMSDKIRSIFANEIRIMENEDFEAFEKMNHKDMVDTMHMITDAPDFNFYHHVKTNKTYIYEYVWEEMDTAQGLQRLLQIMQSSYWNKYESFLLGRILQKKNDSVTNLCINLIKDYYSFILSFDLRPYCNKSNTPKLRDDQDVPHQNTEDYSVFEKIFSLRLFSLYDNIQDQIPRSQTSANRKKVDDIIKRNSRGNLAKLDNHIFELFETNEAFRCSLMH